MQPLHDKHFTLSTAALVHMVQDARERTLALVADLAAAQFEVPLLALVNPFRWELGHVTFFYEAFVLQLLGQTKPLLVGAEDLYDSFKIDHDDRWSLPLPSRQQTLEYMQRVLDAVVERLQGHDPSAQETYLYLLSVLHEDMHGEALTYMRQILSYPAPPLGRTPVALGRGPWPGDVEWWSYQGWVWCTKTQAQHPLYWQRDGQGWLRQHFDTLVPLELHAPVAHVTWYEAEAYCQWAGRRLPTEAEWEMAASAEPTPDGKGITGRKRRYPWGDEPPTPERANLDTRFLGCADVAAFPAGDSAFGCRQMAGNVWEWTESAFYPFPGYLVDYPYREYSAPWFGYRKVLKGGAWATRSRLAYNTYRNFFPPARNDVYAGFRTCAR